MKQAQFIETQRAAPLADANPEASLPEPEPVTIEKLSAEYRKSLKDNPAQERQEFQNWKKDSWARYVKHWNDIS